MASALVERAFREAPPEAVEHELAALWREIARHGTVARAVMSNLVVFRYIDRRSHPRGGDQHARSEAAFADRLDAVVARHPSRAIVIEHDRGSHDVAPPLGAGVGVTIFGPPAARYGVESILVRSACAEASLPSIVRRFVRGGLPTSVWWTEDLSIGAPLASLVTMARQLVYDSRFWRDVGAGVRAVDGLPEIDLADVNWRRLRPLRDLLVDAAGSCGHALVAADRVTIAHAPGDSALAWLLAGWLSARLEWPADAWPTMEPTAGSDLVIMTVRDGDFTLSIAMDDHRVALEATGRPRLVAAATPEHEADAIAAELRTLSRETELRQALRALARRAV
jgi:glucose-6-phosphate dehydrogenase assembly protein OpcA